MRPFTAAAIALLVTLGGCTHDSAAKQSGQPAKPAPSPSLAEVLHTNYRVSQVQQAHLASADGPADEIVISTGPGLDPSQPVEGGTTDVQVLNYDPAGGRWNVVFDAAAELAGMDTGGIRTPWSGQPTDESVPLLSQDDPITDVRISVVHISGGVADLLIFGVDQAANHPIGHLGIIDLHSSGNASARTAYATSGQGLEPPTVIKRGEADNVEVRGQWFTAEDPACCPIRTYTQVIGEIKLDGATPEISVISDDRPWLGMWVSKPDTDDAPPVVVTTVAGSPASTVLRPGDRITAVNGTSTVKAGDSLGLSMLDLIAKHRPGDHVTLTVTRGRAPLTLTVIAGSAIDASARSATAPVQYRLGAQGATAAAGSPPGVLLTAVQGPAEAAGLEAGDEITAIGPIKVRNVADLAVGALSSQGNPITVNYITPDGLSRSAVITPQVADSNASSVLMPAPC